MSASCCVEMKECSCPLIGHCAPPPPRLLAPHSEVLRDLQQLFPCELVVALNGRVWVKASNVQQTLVVANLLQSCDTMTTTQRRQLFRRVAQGAL